MPGPCCYKSNVKAAYVSGIIFIVFWVLTILIKIFDGSDIIGQSHRILFKTIEGIICILINGLLVYGAHARNSAALLVWIVLAVIESGTMAQSWRGGIGKYPPIPERFGNTSRCPVAKPREEGGISRPRRMRWVFSNPTEP